MTQRSLWADGIEVTGDKRLRVGVTDQAEAVAALREAQSFAQLRDAPAPFNGGTQAFNEMLDGFTEGTIRPERLDS